MFFFSFMFLADSPNQLQRNAHCTLQAMRAWQQQVASLALRASHATGHDSPVIVGQTTAVPPPSQEKSQPGSFALFGRGSGRLVGAWAQRCRWTAGCGAPRPCRTGPTSSAAGLLGGTDRLQFQSLALPKPIGMPRCIWTQQTLQNQIWTSVLYGPSWAHCRGI